MRVALFIVAVGVATGMPACHLEDSDRCDDGQLFDGTSCLSPDTDVQIDAGADAGGSGMMEPCEDAADCAEYEANYCMALLPDSNVCLIPDCSTEPDDCPDPNVCCDLLPELETGDLPGSLCMPPDYWETYSMYCVNG